MRLQTLILGVVLVFNAFPLAAEDDTSTQIWLSIVLGHQPTDTLYLEVENQPKVQVSGGERWGNFDATWLAEYYPNRWLDLTAELVTGYTVHTETENSFELTPRVGVRVHLVEQFIKETYHRKNNMTERLPRDRYSTSTFFRLEQRNFFYSGDLDSSHEWRFRIRPEFKAAINNPYLSDDRTFYIKGDVEFFFPISDDVPERFNNKLRFRLGPGYRYDGRVKMELMLMLDENRESELTGFEEDAYMLDLRLTFLF